MKVSQKIICNIAEYCLQLKEGGGTNLYEVMFSTFILGNFEYHAKALGLPFDLEEGFSEDDNVHLLIEAMQETIKHVREE